MAEIPEELASELRRTLSDLRAAKLASSAWPAVAGDLGKLASAVDHGDEAAVRSALVPVSQAAFEGKVRGRLAAADKAAVVVGTKPASALPYVGAVCGALLVVLGYALGGWLVAAGTAVLALLVLGVALAGTRTSRDRAAQRRANLAPSAEPTEHAPLVVAEAIAKIEASLR